MAKTKARAKSISASASGSASASASHAHSHTHYTRSSSGKRSPPRREILAFAVPSGEDGSGDAIVFALAIALGVAMLVVIILICIYASRRNNNDDDTDCQGSRDTRYIDIDVLAQKPVTALSTTAAAVPPEKRTAPVVLAGPLSQTKPLLTKNNSTAVVAEALEVAPVQPLTLSHNTTSAAVVSPTVKKAATTILAEHVPALMASETPSTIFVVSPGCGACIKLKQMLSEIDDASKIQLLEIAELKKLKEEVRHLLASPYIPTMFTAGHGTITKGTVGVPPKDALDALATAK